MIRAFKETDLDAVMEIWLASNIDAHSFIPQSYWEEQFDTVKSLLPQAEVYVYEQENQIVAFVGLMEDCIAGIFVQSALRSAGIGKALLNYCKQLRPSLWLCVYEQNQRAYQFYLREGFVCEKVSIDEATGKAECLMRWNGNQ